MSRVYLRRVGWSLRGSNLLPSNYRGWVLERELSLNGIPRYHSLYIFNISVLIYFLEFLALSFRNWNNRRCLVWHVRDESQYRA